MEIQFLQKVDLTDGVRLSYNIDGKKIFLEITGTAMSVYKMYDLSDDELGMICIPIVTGTYVELNEQEAGLEKISLDSDGVKVKGKIVSIKEEVEEVC